MNHCYNPEFLQLRHVNHRSTALIPSDQVFSVGPLPKRLQSSASRFFNSTATGPGQGTSRATPQEPGKGRGQTPPGKKQKKEKKTTPLVRVQNTPPSMAADKTSFQPEIYLPGTVPQVPRLWGRRCNGSHRSASCVAAQTCNRMVDRDSSVRCYLTACTQKSKWKTWKMVGGQSPCTEPG